MRYRECTILVCCFNNIYTYFAFILPYLLTMQIFYLYICTVIIYFLKLINCIVMVNSNSVNADLLIKINALLCVELLTCTVSENHLVTYCINPIFVDSENNVIVTRKNYLYFNKLSQYCDERRISVTVPIDLCYNRFDTLVLSIRLFDSVPINNTSLLILANFLADFNPQMLIQS